MGMDDHNAINRRENGAFVCGSGRLNVAAPRPPPFRNIAEVYRAQVNLQDEMRSQIVANMA